MKESSESYESYETKEKFALNTKQRRCKHLRPCKRAHARTHVITTLNVIG